jgi:hypothetical protein
MEQINESVVAAERRAQEAYDRALDELRRTGQASSLEAVTLDDEGVAGERIDAELEVVVEWEPATSFELTSGQAPTVTAGAGGPSWVLTVPAHIYRAEEPGARERFRAAESRLYFGLAEPPRVSRRGARPLFDITLAPPTSALVVVIRGNDDLVRQVTTAADWSKVRPPQRNMQMGDSVQPSGQDRRRSRHVQDLRVEFFEHR